MLRSRLACLVAIALTCGAPVAAAESAGSGADSAITSVSSIGGTAVLCEALVFIHYEKQHDRMLLAQSRRIANRMVASAAAALRRSGREPDPLLHASSGILLSPQVTYRLAWERPRDQRVGRPPSAQPPFHTDSLLATETTRAAWRDLARRVDAHDSTTAPEAQRLARQLGVGELLVILAHGSRTTAREHLAAGLNPVASAVDDERLNMAWTTLEVALYDGSDGRRLWAFTNHLSRWNANDLERLGDWTEAAMELMPPPGTQGRHDDPSTRRFHAPYRYRGALRLGPAKFGGQSSFHLGTRIGYLVRPWISAGFQLDWQTKRPSLLAMGGSMTSGGVVSKYHREFHDAEVDFFPIYPTVEMNLPLSTKAVVSAGVSGGYAVAALEAPDYETQFLGSWGWSTHASVCWRVNRGGIGLEWMYQASRPERDGIDPITTAPVRERLDLEGWGLCLTLNAWE